MDSALKTSLLEDMKVNGWKYNHLLIRRLFNGISDDERLRGFCNYCDNFADEIWSQFLLSGDTLKYDELIEHQVVPCAITKEQLLATDYGLEQPCMLEDDIGNVDLLFIGSARSGKTIVTASIMERLQQEGLAQYRHSDSDLFYRPLLNRFQEHKFAVSSDNDAISVVKYKSPNYIDFRLICHGDNFRYNSIFANYYLKNPNKKILILLVDPFRLRWGWDDENSIWLDNFVSMMSYNGEGKDGSKNSTMSKVDSIVLLFSKFDLANLKDEQLPEEWMDNYIKENMYYVYRCLCDVCRRFDINKKNKYKPYIMKHSVGNVYIGNTFVYDPTDSQHLTQFLLSLIPKKFKKPLWRRLF